MDDINRGDGHHGILAQFDENANQIFHAADHTHQHTWDNNTAGDWTMRGTTSVAPSSGQIVGGAASGYTMRPNYAHNDVQIWADDIMVKNRNLTRAVEDMALLLKMIVEKYDLHEVKKLVEDTEVAVWAQDAKYNEKDVCEKKEHLDEKLFEI